MTMLRAQTRIALSDPAAVLRPLCEHMLEHEAGVSEADGVTTIGFGGSRAELRAEPGALSVVIEAPYLAQLQGGKFAIASHVVEFAPEGAAPTIRWCGDGAEPMLPPDFRVLTVTGVEPVTPHMRRIRFRGEDLARYTERQLTVYRRRAVGFVFQLYNLIPSLTAMENVAIATEIATDPLAPAEALELVGLGHRLDHFPAELSGGEQQRVAVARAIAKRPGVLLCDEPTGALDSATGVRVLETLARANRELGTTLVLITHNAGIAAMADRVLHFLDGQIAREQVNAAPIEAGAIQW